MSNKNDKERPRAVRTHDIKLDKEYTQWIYDIKQRFRNAQIKAAIKVNSEQLLFNWQLGRDLVVRKAEEKWGNGIVEQVSLDLQAAFPEAKGFSARNLWNMKKWYSFYTSYEDFGDTVNALSNQMDISSLKLQQVAAEIQEVVPDEKLQQVVAEIPFPALFGFIPWGHHIEINLDMDELDLTDAEKKATYQEIKDYVLEHSGLKVSSLYIAQVKQQCGIIERENYNKPKSEDAKQPQCPLDKEKAIKEALKHFGMI